MEPLGNGPVLTAIALLTTLLANINRGEDAPPFELKDFLIRYGREEDQMEYVETGEDGHKVLLSEEDSEAVVKGFLAAFGGIDKRGGEVKRVRPVGV